jgi:hypothetical protein
MFSGTPGSGIAVIVGCILTTFIQVEPLGFKYFFPRCYTKLGLTFKNLI